MLHLPDPRSCRPILCENVAGHHALLVLLLRALALALDGMMDGYHVYTIELFRY